MWPFLKLSSLKENLEVLGCLCSLFFFFLPRVECIQYSLNKKANLALNKHRKQEESASLAPSTGN